MTGVCAFGHADVGCIVLTSRMQAGIVIVELLLREEKNMWWRRKCGILQSSDLVS